MKKTLSLFITFIILFQPKNVFASSDILINEFVVDQSPQAVEIMNFGTQPVDISSWYLDDNGGTTFYTIPVNTLIYPSSCLIFSSEFNLNKSSPDTIRLFDATAVPTSPSAHLIDSYSYQSSPGGSLSYFRSPDGGGWNSGSSTLGQFNSTGQNCILLPTATPTPLPSPTMITQTPTGIINQIVPTLTQSAIQNIHISEVMPNPKTGENEWVELYNDNEFDVQLQNWYIDDEENAGSAPKQFSLSIPAKGNATYDFSTGIFNNDADSVRLLDPNKSVVDSLQYSVTQKGESIGRTDFVSDTYCNQDPSKNASNSPCIILEDSVPSPTPSPSPSKIPTPTKTVQSTSPLSSIVASANLKTSPTPPYKQYILPFVKNTIVSDSSLPEETPTYREVSGKKPDTKALQASFSFSSSGFSLLGVISIFLKRKFRLL